MILVRGTFYRNLFPEKCEFDGYVASGETGLPTPSYGTNSIRRPYSFEVFSVSRNGGGGVSNA